MKARHSALSFTASCQLGSSARSLLRTSIHLSCVPPGLLCFPCGRHLSTCFWSRWSDILCTWPSHCNRLCLSWTSIGSSPVSSRMSAFRRMSHRVTPHDVLKTSHLECLQLPDVMLGYRPCFCSAQKDRHHHGTKHVHFGGSTEIPVPENFLPPYLIHFAGLLEPHCYFSLQLCCLSQLTAQVGEGLHILQHLALKCDAWLVFKLDSN